ncbi:hypothetical protein HIC20_00595 [Buchnera aphidicola (Hormaphis cornu)]|nr:hypothetical protein HIC20_00595 [Buchnera aphidicola (Hormaphis cornu)]
MSKRLRELSFLNSGISIYLNDIPNKRKEHYHYTGGLKTFIKFLNGNKKIIHSKVFYFLAKKRFYYC